MKSQQKKIASLALFLASPIVLAGPPVSYGGWSVTDGTIDTSLSCDLTGVQCSELVNSKGMMYEQMDVNGSSYLRMIVTEADATANNDPNNIVDPGAVLGFSDESFIPFFLNDNFPSQSNGYNSFAPPQGLAARQVINDSADNFNATTEIQRSNMKQYSGDWSNLDTAEEMFSIKIDQSFSNDEISSGFKHTAYTPFLEAEAATNFTTAIDPVSGQRIGLQDPDSNYVMGSKTDISQTLNFGDTATPNAKQRFEQRNRSGFMGTGLNAYNSYFTKEPITQANSTGMTVGGGTSVDWVEGADISTTWLTQTDGPGGSLVYQTVINKDTAKQDSKLIFDQPTSGVLGWDANFGTQPTP